MSRANATTATAAVSSSSPCGRTRRTKAFHRALIFASVVLVAVLLLLAVSGLNSAWLGWLASHAAAEGGEGGSGSSDWAAHRHARRTDAKAHVAEGRTSGDAGHTPQYLSLFPGEHLLNQSVAYPLYHSRATATTARPFQRYSLRGLREGRRYMVILSFTGSPSVQYSLQLFLVRRSAVERLREPAAPAVRPMDTEIRVLLMHGRDALQFDYSEDVWYDDELLTRPGGDDDDYFVPVLQVEAAALAWTHTPERFPMAYYNIHLEEMVMNRVPVMVFPIVLAAAVTVLGGGLVLLYPLLKAVVGGTDGDSEKKDD